MDLWERLSSRFFQNSEAREEVSVFNWELHWETKVLPAVLIFLGQNTIWWGGLDFLLASLYFLSSESIGGSKGAIAPPSLQKTVIKKMAATCGGIYPSWSPSSAIVPISTFRIYYISDSIKNRSCGPELIWLSTNRKWHKCFESLYDLSCLVVL